MVDDPNEFKLGSYISKSGPKTPDNLKNLRQQSMMNKFGQSIGDAANKATADVTGVDVKGVAEAISSLTRTKPKQNIKGNPGAPETAYGNPTKLGGQDITGSSIISAINKLNSNVMGGLENIYRATNSTLVETQLQNAKLTSVIKGIDILNDTEKKSKQVLTDIYDSFDAAKFKEKEDKPEAKKESLLKEEHKEDKHGNLLPELLEAFGIEKIAEKFAAPILAGLTLLGTTLLSKLPGILLSVAIVEGIKGIHDAANGTLNRGFDAVTGQNHVPTTESEFKSLQAESDRLGKALEDHKNGWLRKHLPWMPDAAGEELRREKEHADKRLKDAKEKGVDGGGDNSGGDPGKTHAGKRGWWTDERQAHAYDVLTKEGGLTDLGAKALISRWKNVEATNGPTDSNNKGGGHIGIAQWGRSRQKETGVTLDTDFDGQLHAAIKELNTTEKKSKEILNNATTAAEAARGAATFERAEGWNGHTDNFQNKTEAGMGGITTSVAPQGSAPVIEKKPEVVSPAPINSNPKIGERRVVGGTTQVLTTHGWEILNDDGTMTNNSTKKLNDSNVPPEPTPEAAPKPMPPITSTPSILDPNGVYTDNGGKVTEKTDAVPTRGLNVTNENNAVSPSEKNTDTTDTPTFGSMPDAGVEPAFNQPQSNQDFQNESKQKEVDDKLNDANKMAVPKMLPPVPLPPSKVEGSEKPEHRADLPKRSDVSSTDDFYNFYYG